MVVGHGAGSAVDSSDVNRPQCIRVCEIDIHQQLILCASATMYWSRPCIVVVEIVLPIGS